MDRGIGSWVTGRASLDGDRVALVEGSTELTYEAFERRTNQLARALLGLGVRRGDRVGVLLLNSVAFMEVVFATAKLGAIVVPINYRLQAPEIGYILSDAGIDVFAYHPTLAGVARGALAEPGVRVRHRVPRGIAAGHPGRRHRRR